MTFRPPASPPGPPAPRAFLIGLATVLPLVVLAVLFGNPWFRDWWFRQHEFRNDYLQPIQSVSFLDWGFTRYGQPPMGYVVIDLFGTLLALGLTVLLAALAGRTVDPRRGAFGALVSGWWAALVACGLGGFVKGLATFQYDDLPAPARLLWSATESGLAFGFFYGWLGGLAALLAFLVGRGRTPRAAGYPAGAPYAPPPAPPAAPYGPPGAPPAAPPGWGGPGTPPPYPQPGWGGPQPPPAPRGDGPPPPA
ncbi:hypothetical protein [Actinomadura rayongensis]|uniref:Uncharacterized protein n=1 Tax=Actinomadura rayongensis TaxID=1429076 RepID=A0A6I4WFW4_9ACTN|nr:hypothetical protein [Actinomadura rayongensis]MXQ65884.1 hypothetical protein [Actinomadura rayongensis]